MNFISFENQIFNIKKIILLVEILLFISLNNQQNVLNTFYSDIRALIYNNLSFGSYNILPDLLILSRSKKKI